VISNSANRIRKDRGCLKPPPAGNGNALSFVLKQVIEVGIRSNGWLPRA
jgi:hypothetical protein